DVAPGLPHPGDRHRGRRRARDPRRRLHEPPARTRRRRCGHADRHVPPGASHQEEPAEGRDRHHRSAPTRGRGTGAMTRRDDGTLDIGVYGARSIPSTYSGYETFLTTLLPQLTARGHAVTLYCRRTEDREPGPYEGVERVWLPALPGKQFNTLSH